MIADLPNDKDFVIRPGTIAGEPINLVFPKNIGVDWTKDNLIFRSSIWHTNTNQLISAGFKKFVNWGEKPILFTLPKDIKNAKAIAKIDGSCLIISKYKGELITRTRGTIDARQMDNGYEIDYLKELYPKLFSNELLDSEECSILVEWVSPKNVIVLNYGDDPDVYLTGIILHKDYSYFTQDELDNFATIWGIKRPHIHNFYSIPEMLESIKNLKGQEGICLYYNNDQNILKIKSADYLLKHAFKSELNIPNLLEIYLEWDMPDYQEFLNRLEKEFDFECMTISIPLVSKILDAKKDVFNITDHMKTFTDTLKELSRKDAAAQIISSYGKTNRSGYVFKILDNKPLIVDDYKKLFLQILKGET